MMISMVGSSQMNLARMDLGYKEVGLCNFSRNLNFAKISSQKNSMVWLGQSSVPWSSRSFLPLICNASAISKVEAVVSEKVSANKSSKADKDLRLFASLPLDAL
ncbi:OLC1v1004233C1 [Oldenlandia corymbosa var. corymbosa]|uniref:OLC1v1004233C1 n=1 Tax=Oldenlandia corymbosa var. corymbosa TaxID=529605 RepID=A0AAV1DDQ4_OLDCO|nr:OLC1v1004233C1 [Oldenlandia corymbosa var. corymbosa]